MSEEIKVSEMQEAEEVNDEDIVMVIQKKVNKKAKIKQIKNELAVSPTQPTTNEKVWFKCGKNKFDSDELSSKTALGITTSFSNSIMTINGTSTGNGIMYAQSLTKIVLEAGTYTWSMNKKSGTVTRTTQAAALYLRKSGTTTNIATISAETFATTDTKSVTFTLTERTAIDFYAYVNATGLAFNNLALEVQIERGSAATTYEEYVEPVIYVKNNNNVYEEFIKKEEDSGWIPLILKDGVSVSTINNISQVPQYRKIGNHVFVRGYISTTWTPGSNKLIATLPYSPKNTVYKLGPLTQTNLARIFVAPNRKYKYRVDT